mmetsp:Transcript_34835/g.81358  ORF Transcript_34835/g.81358 Transcript_34835/m.81358 type:complete len:445 (+) Transcript_34835:67-1401(+)
MVQVPSGVRTRKLLPRLLAAGFATAALSALSCAFAGLSSRPPVQDRPRVSRADADPFAARPLVQTVSLKSLASHRMKQSFWRRLPGDIAAVFTAPLRIRKLLTITKEVIEEMKRQRMPSSGSSSSGSSKTKMLQDLLPIYAMSHVISRTEPEYYRDLLNTSLNLLVDSISAKEPSPFEPFHKAIRGPGLDYYSWGNNFFRSMVKFRSSRVEGVEHVKTIKELLSKGENVILLANHQTEADPQVLSLLLETVGYEELAEKAIFVAGHKVTTDPLAVPFSLGRNLLTIFSKKYLDSFGEEEKAAKSKRNQETVSEMQKLFQEGGNLIWVAPSGGRDRKSAETGRFEPAAFDMQSVGLFYLLAQKAAKGGGPKTHFVPLAMWSHQLVPPPDDAKAAVGEDRSVKRANVALEFGAPMDPEALGGRKKFPAAAEKQVRDQYSHLDKVMR